MVNLDESLWGLRLNFKKNPWSLPSPLVFRGYKKQLSQKWLAVLQAASSCLEATTLVVPDAGCGLLAQQ